MSDLSYKLNSAEVIKLNIYYVSGKEFEVKQ